MKEITQQRVVLSVLLIGFLCILLTIGIVLGKRWHAQNILAQMNTVNQDRQIGKVKTVAIYIVMQHSKVELIKTATIMNWLHVNAPGMVCHSEGFAQRKNSMRYQLKRMNEQRCIALAQDSIKQCELKLSSQFPTNTDTKQSNAIIDSMSNCAQNLFDNYVKQTFAQNEIVKTGNFSYVVNNAVFQQRTIPGGTSLKSAQEVNVVVDVVISNLTNVVQLIPPLLLVDEQGREFNMEISPIMVKNALQINQKLQAKESKDLTLVFTVPYKRSYFLSVRGDINSLLDDVIYLNQLSPARSVHSFTFDINDIN